MSDNRFDYDMDLSQRPKKNSGKNTGMAVMMALCVLFSGAAGFGGGVG